MTTLDDIRRLAVGSSLFAPTTLERAIDKLGFVQADPIRAPARAQDLILRPRVAGYRAGDLERRYPALDVEEDVFINYGFVTRAVHALMHPRAGASLLPTAGNKRARALLMFVSERGTVHPREVDAHFSHGTVTNYWGGSSSATTHLLEAMHYKGLLRVARRDNGIRIYAPHQHGPAALGAAERKARVDALVDIVVSQYAPLPASSLSQVIGRLRYAVPQWRGELRGALQRARQRLARAEIVGQSWYWPETTSQTPQVQRETVHLLAPFDPVVWDRRRFELLWGWPYRFEAYTPVSKRKLAYYALPMVWRDRVIGWSALSIKNGALNATFGYAAGKPPRDRGFKHALDEELERMRVFLAYETTKGTKTDTKITK
jgi:uncharacterized protein YcaQ